MSPPTKLSSCKILILRSMPVAEDGPTQRQARFLAQSHEVTVMGLGRNPFADEPHIRWLEANTSGSKITNRDAKRAWYERVAPLLPQLWFRHMALTHQHRYMAAAAQSQRWDVILCNDVDTLVAGLSAKKYNRSCRCVLAIRDFPTRQYDSQEIWWVRRKRWATRVLRHFASQVDAVVTVADAFPQLLREEFGLKQATVIYNAPELVELPEPCTAEASTPRKWQIVHHGVCARDRELELLLQAMACLDTTFELNLMLTSRDDAYLAELKSLAIPLGDRVRFLPPVPTREIAATLAKFDIGVHFQPAKTFNALHAMPNKFFDFIMAGLAVVTGPYAEMSPIIVRENIGWCSENFTPAALASLLTGLTVEKVAAAKAASRQLRLKLNAEEEMAKLSLVIQNCLPKSKRANAVGA